MSMTHALCKRFVICLTLLTGSAAFSQVCLSEAPRFAEAGRDIAIQAVVDDSAKNVTLNWTCSSGKYQAEMTADGEANRWTGTIPAQAVEGAELTYAVSAAYDDGSSTASPDCTLFICPEYTILEPQPLAVQQTILVEKEWNSDDGAFGLYKSTNGPPLGPAAIAGHDGRIYVLDSVKNRVLGFTPDGDTFTTIPVPTSGASDLIVDPSNGSILVVSQLEDKVYEFQNGQLKETRSVSLKENFEYPAKFSYDCRAKTLYARNQNHLEKLAAVSNPSSPDDLTEQQKTQQVTTDVKGQNLILKTDNSPDIFAVPFDRPVGYIDETVTDGNGIVWVLYTLEGDYRARRLARIDTLNRHAETAQVDVWFSFDATRRMTVTDTGLALMAGDTSHGRIVTFDYTGDR